MQSSIASGLTRTLALGGLIAGLAFTGFVRPDSALAQLAPAAMPVLPSAAREAAPAVSDPRNADTALTQARRLFDENRAGDALAAIEVALEVSPSDPRLRFLKGVILSHEGRDEDAIAVFRALSQDFPELPEPYNNLAALYAARGQLDEARAALDEAIRALPNYALAQENLGDVYLRLAIRAWARAAQLDPSASATAAKLKLARQIATAAEAGGSGSPALPGAR
jgi:Flp pilus assembly protein TadD